MPLDLACALLLASFPPALGATYALRVAVHGRARFARVDAEMEAASGTTAPLRKGAMEMLYWCMRPLGDACVRLGVGANAITWMSLALALAAGVALGAGHLGLAALLSIVASGGDALDGYVARATSTSSNAGEVLDAAVDRYSELAFLGGVAVHVRESAWLLALTVAALGGSFMVSYATAKAEALDVSIPRGAMRRTERAVLLIAGAGLGPIVASLSGVPAWGDVPLLVSVALVAVIGNVSAIRRLAAIARATSAPGSREGR